MVGYRGVHIHHDHSQFKTEGLKPFLGFELKVKAKGGEKDDYYRVLKFLIDYIMDYRPNLVSGQTISYYSWLLKIERFDQHYCDLFEANADGDGFAVGVEYSIKVVRDQEEECGKYGVSPIFPTFSQNIVISKGVYEGLGIEAVRYPSPDHMTGWWITTELYDDDIDSLLNVHFFHLAFQRPDLLRYLALPFGYRLYLSKEKQDICFDENALE